MIHARENHEVIHQFDLPEPLVLYKDHQVIYADGNRLKRYWVNQPQSETIKDFENTIQDIQLGTYGLLVIDVHGNVFLSQTSME
ncbi:hypothetical protein [Rubeoparvulum massiliense]|uniref:hypothetical protein n=1 Tax=Rubeoparvulum massiliense TaxID=1631346 RepID=UPI00065E71D3|nr:hypothetical protein [Rubeoparvulum massiliense]